MSVGFLGGTPGTRPALYRRASPVNLVTNTSPPILTIHGDADPFVPVREALAFDRKMNDLGRVHTLIVSTNAGHGNPWYVPEVWSFLDGHLKPGT